MDFAPSKDPTQRGLTSVSAVGSPHGGVSHKRKGRSAEASRAHSFFPLRGSSVLCRVGIKITYCGGAPPGPSGALLGPDGAGWCALFGRYRLF